MAVLSVRDLRAGYGPIDVLHDVSIEVNEGEIVCIIGANGAGKTTTLLAISGIVRPRKGAIAFAGNPIDTLPAHQIVRLGLSHVPEGRKIFARMTVRENLEMGAYTRSDAGIADDLEKMYTLFPILQKRQSQPGGLLSGGEQQMLAIARALMARPRLLLLDEPSLGLAPQIVSQIFEVIRDLNQKQGVSVLLVEQNARMALKTAHRGYVLETGRVTLADRAESLLNDPRIRTAYLGE